METNIAETPALFDAMAWFEKNKKMVAIGLIGIAVVGVVVAYTNASKKEREQMAGQELSRALLAPMLDRAASQSESAAGLLKVAADNGGTQAGEQALLLAGGALYRGGKFAEAQAAFERFGRERPGSELAPQALYGVGASFAALGKLDEAAKAFKETVDRYPNSSVGNQARYSLATALSSQGKLEQAMALYEEVARGGSNNSLSNEASLRADELRAKLPAIIAPAPIVGTNVSGAVK